MNNEEQRNYWINLLAEKDKEIALQTTYTSFYKAQAAQYNSLLDARVEQVDALNVELDKVKDDRADLTETVNIKDRKIDELRVYIQEARNEIARLTPEGYVLVPIRPTAAMIDAGNDVDNLYKRGTPNAWGEVYRAMIAAAPTPA